MATNDDDNTPATTFLASTALAATNRFNLSDEEDIDPFWVHSDDLTTSASRWNKSYPYQFLVVVQQEDGTYSTSGALTEGSTPIFTLPFPPESMNISMPFAINGQVTQGGYIEEHNGAPIRNISISGTTGILPLRPRADVFPTPSLGAALFGGTIAAVNRGIGKINKLLGPSFPSNTVDEDVFGDPESDNTGMAKTSGYYQFRLLQEFLESYVSFKKNPKNRDARLAFACWKDESVYLVTPQTFNVNRSASSPFEYTYQISLRAWRRVKLNGNSPEAFAGFVPAGRDQGTLASIAQALANARDVLESVRGVLSAVISDIDHALFGPLREVMGFVKDLAGIALLFTDFPGEIINMCKNGITQFLATAQAIEGASDTIAAAGANTQKAFEEFGSLAQETFNSVTGNTPSPARIGVEKTTQATSTHPANDVFNNPEEHYDLFKAIPFGKINAPPEAIKAVVNIREGLRAMTRLDFEKIRDNFVQVQAAFADAVGAGDAIYDATFHRVTKVTPRTPTLSDYQILFSLNRIIMETNKLAVSGTINQNKIRSIDFVAGLASRSGIAFQKPRSKFSVPFPYGSTIEQIATRYLGNPDRWFEIVALNGLRAPYVDEEGFDLTLLVNGRENQISVSDASHLYVGQQVWLSSTSASRTIRRITEIKTISEDNNVLTLDGDADLERYTTLGSATIHAFLPNTVNSQMMLFIPSNTPAADEDLELRQVPGLDIYDQLLNVGGFDLLLTSTNDLAITPDGDCRLAVGLANIVQTARTRIQVVRGTLNRHPGFGLPLKIGQSTADLDANQLLQAVKNLFSDDPVFLGVKSASVRQVGPVASIALSVAVRGQSNLIPLTFDLK